MYVRAGAQTPGEPGQNVQAPAPAAAAARTACEHTSALGAGGLSVSASPLGTPELRRLAGDARLHMGSPVSWAPSIAAVTWAHRLHLGVGGDQEVPPPPISVSSVPSDREQAALEKTNIYSSNGSWHRLFPATGVGLACGMDTQEPLREMGRCPEGTGIPDATMSSRWGQRVPRRHPTQHSSACAPSGQSPASKFIPEPARVPCPWPLL